MNILEGIWNLLLSFAGAAQQKSEETDKKMTNYVKNLSDEQLQKAAITSKGKGGEKYVQKEIERRKNGN